jgi:hypothetical protein
MTQDEIIEMARQAGFTQPEGEIWYEAFPQCIEAFAKLVAAKALAQRTWVGLAKEDRLCAKYMQDAPDGIEAVIDYIESKLKERNT